MELSDELIKKLKADRGFKIFQEYIIGKIAELNSVSGLDSMDNSKAGEEAKTRLKAKRKLEDILKPFIEFSEKRTPTDDEYNVAKNNAGL